MAGNVSEESSVGRSMEGKRCQSSDALVEWRSSEQVENGTPSTSPPYWDTDDSDDDGGPKPSELYGKYTWKIEKFSQINKRELRSNAFEVGGYKWYILIYPQGCDVCNHLSLFLCVANHDKLLPGWSHFAQFTIAVVNKDPKKSKYSDTLHRFWKKEHDWGWKKFMELSKVSDGFLDSDTLIIKAQVQVIREKADRPFRCLDCQYRRELVRVYLTNVEQICRRFVEERRGKLGKLIEDKARWSSFCAFWLGMDQNTRCRMSMEKKDMILKVVVKHFFIEKEVTSTLVMDSLYSGLKALEGQSKGNKGKVKSLDGEETPAPIVQVEKDMFILVDDVLLLLERAAVEPLPPKDDKGPQNRTKDGGNGEEFNRDTIERDERRLTELGRRTVEIFALAHIFSNKIEVAYQEAVALKRQEELIREEEAAWLAQSEQKTKRGADKDKKSKKKQSKQKRNNRKGKDKGKDDKAVVAMDVKHLHENPAVENSDLLETRTIPEKDDDILEDVSDVSDSEECAADISEEREESPLNWDTDISEIHVPAEVSGSEISIISTSHNGGVDKKSSSFMDDSSSTCSTDSAPSIVANGSCRSNAFVSYVHKSPTRGKNQRGKMIYDEDGGATHSEKRPYVVTGVGFQIDTWSQKAPNDSEGVVTSLQDRTKWPELSAVKKDEEAVVLQKKPSKVSADAGTSRDKTAKAPSLCRSPPKIICSVQAVQSKSESNSISHTYLNPVVRKTSLNVQQQSDKPSSPVKASSSPVKTSSSPAKASSSPAKASSSPAKASSSPAKASSSPVKACQTTAVSNPDGSKTCPKPAEKPTGQQAGGLSRPSSAPVTPAEAMLSTPGVSMAQTLAPSTPLLSRPASATGRLGPDPSSVGVAYVPQSYRNAITGSNSLNPSSVDFPQPSQPPSLVNGSTAFSQQPTFVPSSMYLPQVPDRLEPNRVTLSNTFSATPQQEVLGSHHLWMETLMLDCRRSDLYRPLNHGSHELFSELSTGTSGRQVQGAVADEFPHLDIINDLLDDEHGLGRANTVFPGRGNCPNLFNGQYAQTSNTGLLSEMGPLASSSRFDRSRSYHDDGYQQEYGPSNHYDAVGEFIPQGNALTCMNGQFESLGPNQWQYPDLSMLGLSSEMDGYPYSVSDYSNMVCGVNGYTMFRPSNGH